MRLRPVPQDPTGRREQLSFDRMDRLWQECASQHLTASGNGVTAARPTERVAAEVKDPLPPGLTGAEGQVDRDDPGPDFGAFRAGMAPQPLTAP